MQQRMQQLHHDTQQEWCVYRIIRKTKRPYVCVFVKYYQASYHSNRLNMYVKTKEYAKEYKMEAVSKQSPKNRRV